MSWLYFEIPWWFWLAGVGAIVGLLWVYFGTKAALAGAAVGAGLVLHQRGAQKGYRAAQAKQKADAAKTVKKAAVIKKKVAARKPAENRKRLKKWKKP